MNIVYYVGLCVLVVFIAALSGFFYGRSYEREEISTQAIHAYQNASEIQNEINNLDNYSLCLRLGGLPDNCKFFMRRLDKAASSK